VVEPLDRDRYNQRPAENEWSVAEIVHHLCLVEERVIAELEKALLGERQSVGLLQRFIPISIVGSRLIRVQAPRAVIPTNPPEKDATLEKFEAARKRLKELCLAQGKEKLKQAVVKHPFLGNIHGATAVSMVGYHELRHYKQIRELLSNLGLTV
jgi:hypothetical protein